MMMVMSRMETVLLVFLSALVCSGSSTPISALAFELNVEESDAGVSAVTMATQCKPTPLDTSDESLRVLCTNHNFLGSACLFACGLGLILSGNSVIVCEDQGRWSDTIPTCETLETLGCRPKLRAPDQGWMRCSEDGRSCDFGCADDLVLIGRSKMKCGSEGNWDSFQPLCVETSAVCTELTENFQHGYVSCSLENAPGSVCDVFCDEGFVANGSVRLTCGRGGLWSDTVPSCVPQSGVVSCEEKLVAPLNGFVECTGSRPGSICTFRCDAGFGTDGERFSLCQNGTWSHPSPSCIEMKCPSVRDRIKGGNVVCTSGNNIGSLCRFSCNGNLVLEGSEYSQCLGDDATQSAKWSMTIPGCIHDPDKIPSPVRRKFPSWLICFMQPNQKSCLTKFFFYCILTGQKCL